MREQWPVPVSSNDIAVDAGKGKQLPAGQAEEFRASERAWRAAVLSLTEDPLPLQQPAEPQIPALGK
jgi:hypothetical protein